MTQSLFSLLYTSARADQVANCIQCWDSRAVLNQHEWICTANIESLDVMDQFVNLAAHHDIKYGHTRPGLSNCVEGWNLAAESATGKVLIVVSDDFKPCENWDLKLSEFMGGKWMNQERVLLLNDGYLSDICTIPVLTRKRYEAIGYVFYPGYESQFADTDLTAQARADGVLLNARSIGVFEHLHPDCQKRARDGVDLKHASLERYDRGQRLFHIRKTLGFPLEDGLTPWMERELDPRPQIERMRFAALFVCNKDDFCLGESVKALQDQGVQQFFVAVPDETWNGEKTPDENYHQIMHVIDAWSGSRENWKGNIISLSKFREKFPEPNHHLIEAELRNQAVNWVWSQGFDHVLIVDADELWIPGALSMVANLIEVENPKAIAMNMIPVAGLPGYPIEGAKDSALVYLKKGERFASTRGLDLQGHEIARIQQRGIYHFTATRRTYEEIVQKHRLSGHYQDPSYEMERWIKETLPVIQPGMQGPVHMFTGDDIWPLVRAWLPEEREMIPESLHPYLGFP